MVVVEVVVVVVEGGDGVVVTELDEVGFVPALGRPPPSGDSCCVRTDNVDCSSTVESTVEVVVISALVSIPALSIGE
jgi:hypothetical protein